MCHCKDTFKNQILCQKRTQPKQETAVTLTNETGHFIISRTRRIYNVFEWDWMIKQYYKTGLFDNSSAGILWPLVNNIHIVRQSMCFNIKRLLKYNRIKRELEWRFHFNMKPQFLSNKINNWRTSFTINISEQNFFSWLVPHILRWPCVKVLDFVRSHYRNWPLRSMFSKSNNNTPAILFIVINKKMILSIARNVL